MSNRQGPAQQAWGSVVMSDRAQSIRDGIRLRYVGRTREYATNHAASHAAHSDLLIARVRPQPGERVLDVATGPGGVALAAAAAVGPTGYVLATDLVSEWAEVVEEACARADLANVTFRAMGAESLNVPDACFDVALCKLGLMFVPDPVLALREMRRVLRKGGRLGIVVWSTADRVLHHGIAQRVLESYSPPIPPEWRLPGPLDLGDPGLIERHVVAAGFRDVLVERHTLECVYRDPEAYFRRHLESDAFNAPPGLRGLTAGQRERLYCEVRRALEPYRRGDRICLPSEAIYVIARC